jgi:hypothetical protein
MKTGDTFIMTHKTDTRIKKLGVCLDPGHEVPFGDNLSETCFTALFGEGVESYPTDYWNIEVINETR